MNYLDELMALEGFDMDFEFEEDIDPEFDMNEEDMAVFESMDSAYDFMIAMEKAKMLRGMSKEDAIIQAKGDRADTYFGINKKYGSDAAYNHKDTAIVVKHPSKKNLDKHQPKGVKRDGNLVHSAYMEHNIKHYDKMNDKYGLYKD